jgi:hypothetical protein
VVVGVRGRCSVFFVFLCSVVIEGADRCAGGAFSLFAILEWGCRLMAEDRGSRVSFL